MPNTPDLKEFEDTLHIPPSDANWYWLVVHSNKNGETSYSDGYSIEWPDKDTLLRLFEDGYGLSVIEMRTTMTPKGKTEVGCQ